MTDISGFLRHKSFQKLNEARVPWLVGGFDTGRRIRWRNEWSSNDFTQANTG
jgi:hypothetical protein